MQVSKNPYHLTQQAVELETHQVENAKKDMRNFSVLYDKYYAPVFRFIFQRIYDEEVAADICSTVFMNAMTNLNNYRFIGLPFSSWLFRIARNECNQHFRNKKKEKTIQVKTENIVDIIDEIDEGDDRMILLDYMIKALTKLSDEDLELIELRYFEQRSFKETAEIMEITENNAKVRVFRILKKMKQLIQH